MKKVKHMLFKRILLFVMFAAVCAGVFVTAQKGAETGTASSESPPSEQAHGSAAESEADKPEMDELEVHFIDVGQGDCTLIICGGQAMLIDAGDNSRGTAIQLYLQKRGITHLDYVIATHPDADHIGGLDVVLTKFDCGRILMTDVSSDTATYRDVTDAMQYRGYVSTLPKVGSVYSLGDAEFTVIAPNGSYEDTNNASVGIRLVHGENSFLFTGDAEGQAEADILENGLEISADVLKAGHHGSASSTSSAFLEAVKPAYGVISCGADNAYGHPSAQTLNTLREKGISVFRTDEQGTVIALSDGRDISFSCPPSDSWKAGEPGPMPAAEKEEGEEGVSEKGEGEKGTETTYILNVNTKKFHYPDCFGVEAMAEENKLPAELTREEMIEKGYTPCGSCRP